MQPAHFAQSLSTYKANTTHQAHELYNTIIHQNTVKHVQRMELRQKPECLGTPIPIIISSSQLFCRITEPNFIAKLVLLYLKMRVNLLDMRNLANASHPIYKQNNTTNTSNNMKCTTKWYMRTVWAGKESSGVREIWSQKKWFWFRNVQFQHVKSKSDTRIACAAWQTTHVTSSMTVTSWITCNPHLPITSNTNTNSIRSSSLQPLYVCGTTSITYPSITVQCSVSRPIGRRFSNRSPINWHVSQNVRQERFFCPNAYQPVLPHAN